MFCAKCGKESERDSQFCPKCGHPITSHRSEPRTKNKAILGIAGMVLVIAIVAFTIWHATGKTAVNVPTPQLTTQAPVPQTAAPQPASQLTSRTLSPQQIFDAARGGMVLIDSYDGQGRQRDQGSGFIVSADGTAVTNYHVIRGAFRATGKFDDGTVSDVVGVLGYDLSHDVAVLRFRTAPKTVVNLGDSNAVQVGQKVVVIGPPLGVEDTLSVGLVSELRNGLIQMSAPVGPASSGGAVFDLTGKVVGLSGATAIGGPKLDFAVPIDWAKPILSSESVTPLDELATVNTVNQDLLTGSLPIAPRAAKRWNIRFNPNLMADAEIDGKIASTGGLGHITLALFYRKRRIYHCHSTTCEIHQRLAAPGLYQLVLDNRISPMFGRTVNGQIVLKYVK